MRWKFEPAGTEGRSTPEQLKAFQVLFQRALLCALQESGVITERELERCLERVKMR